MSELTRLTGELAAMKTKMVNRLVAQGDETIQATDSMDTIVSHYEHLRKINNQEITITENGSYRATGTNTGLNNIVVNVPDGGPATHKLYSLLERVYDDDENAIGTVVGFHTDASNKEYAVIALDAQFRLASGQYLDTQVTVPDLPSYNNAGAYGARETATFNCDKILAVAGHASSAVSHCRAQTFTIGGHEYAGQLPTIMELLKILEFMAEVNAADTSATDHASLILKASNQNIWSSTQYSSVNGWYINSNGSANYASKTGNNFVAPVLEIPNTVA